MNEWADFLISLLKDEVMHFALAFVAGYLVFSWILTTLYVQYLVLANLAHKQVSTGVVYFILFIAILGLLSAVLLSHSALDGLLLWWQTPLGPPLELDLGGANF